MNRLSKVVKQQIVSDWSELYPQLGIFSLNSMLLLKRSGPIVLGLQLRNIPYTNTYWPIAGFHNLCIPIPFISLYPSQALKNNKGKIEEIRIEDHIEKYKMFAMKLETSIYLKLRGDTRYSEVIKWYNYFIDSELPKMNPNSFNPKIFEDILLLQTWAGKSYKELKLMLDSFKERNEMTRWAFGTFAAAGEYHIHGWYNKMDSLIQQRESVLQTVEAEIIKHKLDKVPSNELIID